MNDVWRLSKQNHYILWRGRLSNGLVSPPVFVIQQTEWGVGCWRAAVYFLTRSHICIQWLKTGSREQTGADGSRTYHITLHSENSVCQTLYCNPFDGHFGDPALPVIISAVDLLGQPEVCHAHCHVVTQPVRQEKQTDQTNSSKRDYKTLLYSLLTCSCEPPGHDAGSYDHWDTPSPKQCPPWTSGASEWARTVWRNKHTQL